ncbi:MAG TPA: Spy/CpxP family protein refolding chaperone [Methylocystis sp.]
MNSHKQSTRKILSRGRVAGAAAFFMMAGVALAQAPQSAPAPAGGMDHGAMGHDMKGMDMKGMDMKGVDGMGGMEHGGGGMMGGMEHGGGMAGMMRHMLCGVTEHVEGRLAYLKAELKLTDAQQAAWNTFADAYRATTQKTAKVCAEMDAAGPDHSMHKGVLGHLTMMEHHMTAHLDSVRGLKAAIEPLFAVLTEEQKKTADHVMAHIMGIGMSMGGGMGGMMGGGMDHGGGTMDGMGKPTSH